MPIYDLGYRNWKGCLTPPILRWWIVARLGIGLAWKSLALRRLLLVAWIPTIYFGMAFFAQEFLVKYSVKSPHSKWAREFLQESGPISEELFQRLLADPVAVRHCVWASLLCTFLQIPQTILLILLVGILSPPLISQDRRTRAFLLYFSSPLTQREYILGKSTILWFYLVFITLLPAMALYGTALLLSPSLGVFWETWDLPFRILAGSLILLIPSTLLSLAISSLCYQSHYASFAWFIIWIFGGILHTSSLLDGGEKWSMVSLFHVMGRAERWIFGLSDKGADALALLAVITVLSLWILKSKISSSMSVVEK